MSFYLVTPVAAIQCVRQAGSLKAATARALKEHPAGIRSVEHLRPERLAAMAAEGTPLPVAARTLVAAYVAERRRKERIAARNAAARPEAREAAARAKEELRERERAERVRLREEAREARRREKLRVQREERKRTAAAARELPAPVVIDCSDHSAPW